MRQCHDKSKDRVETMERTQKLVYPDGAAGVTGIGNDFLPISPNSGLLSAPSIGFRLSTHPTVIYV